MGGGCSKVDVEQDRGNMLIQAVLSKKWKEVDFLSKRCTEDEMNARGEMNGTALIWAAAHKHLQTVKVLLKRGADPDLQTDDGRCCLHAAAMADEPAICREIIASGGSLELVTPTGLTPLMAAAQFGAAHASATLVNAGAELEAVAKDCRTALHFACEEAHHAVVDILLEAGASAQLTDHLGLTPLHLAALHGHLTIMVGGLLLHLIIRQITLLCVCRHF
jgi:ankyrin repeat protein